MDNVIDIMDARKSYGASLALDSCSLSAGRELVSIVGPSGCGKSTLLSIINGTRIPDSGHIYCGGVDITRLPASKRPVNTVFQSYALFPHMTARANIEFGLRSRGIPDADVVRDTAWIASMMDITGILDRMPDTLSGGQRQRVAFARAAVCRPLVLLLDEPMSALDAKLRHRIQEELGPLRRRLDSTFILVTHDQAEAMAVSDRVFVMDSGRIIQSGTPEDVWTRPKTRFVADFFGSANIIPGERITVTMAMTPIGGLETSVPIPWQAGELCARPDFLDVADPVPDGTPNTFNARITNRVFRGVHYDVQAERNGIVISARSGKCVQIGANVSVFFPAGRLVPLGDG